MKNSFSKGQFPRKARPSSRGRFGKTHSGTVQGSAAKRDLVKPVRIKGPSPIPTRAPGEFPMRINKYLSWKGYCTRSGADDLIKKHAVTLNGRLAVLGDQVQSTDTVELRANRPQETHVYYAYNKAQGISTEPTTKGTSISQKINLTNVFPVGGLDTNSEGLVILTNDRRIVNRLLNPAHSHMKEYVVRTVNPLKPHFKEKMEAGVTLGTAAPIQCKINLMRENQFAIRVAETDARVRQMTSLFFAEAESITRTEMLNIRLEKLPPNSYRKIEGDELKEFLNKLGL
jgi:23S rRNA pseudouridine2604 synthase